MSDAVQKWCKEHNTALNTTLIVLAGGIVLSFLAPSLFPKAIARDVNLIVLLGFTVGGIGAQRGRVYRL
jgi:hypothetical protein